MSAALHDMASLVSTRRLNEYSFGVYATEGKTKAQIPGPGDVFTPRIQRVVSIAGRLAVVVMAIRLAIAI
jgi:hypothetical protein